MRVSIWSSTGSYNWANPAEKQTLIQLKIHDAPEGFPKSISETWDEDEAPDIEGEPPSLILDLIEERVDSYWISTSRDKTKADIAKLREIAPDMDSAWAEAEIRDFQLRIEALRGLVQTVVEEGAA